MGGPFLFAPSSYASAGQPDQSLISGKQTERKLQLFVLEVHSFFLFLQELISLIQFSISRFGVICL